jgi:hypothetical protein
VLSEVIEKDIIPSGYGLYLSEWEDDEYPLFEVITTGRWGKRDMEINLSDSVWHERAKHWVQALDVLLHF